MTMAAAEHQGNPAVLRGSPADAVISARFVLRTALLALLSTHFMQIFTYLVLQNEFADR